ncbi:MAG: tetratricopeptide repeat protein, partial [Cyanobacteria bacterium REEB65]|nr:tetratricopeptide repeat protein [Cyanobacteria bacterium REEB65]
RPFNFTMVAMAQNLSLALAAWLALPLGFAPAPSNPERQLAEARLLAIADGDPAAAVSLLRPLVAHSDGSLKAAAADELGEALDALGLASQAVAAFRSALAADSADSRAARELALAGGLGISAAADSPPSAPSQAVRPVAAVTARANAPGGLALLLPPESRPGFESQVAAFERQRVAQALLGQAKHLWDSGDADSSLMLYNELVVQLPSELKPGDLLDIGDRALAKGRADLAASAYRSAAEREDPGHAPWAYFQLGEALLHAGDMREAQVAFARVAREGPNARSPQGNPLHYLAEERLRETRGISSWASYVAVQALFRQGQAAQYERHQLAAAEQIYRRIVNEFPHSNFDGRALVQLAAISYYERGSALPALRELEDVLSDDRRNDIWPDGMRAGAWALYYEGRIREAIGDKAGARSAYRRELSLYPHNRDHDGKTFASKAQQRLMMLGNQP